MADTVSVRELAQRAKEASRVLATFSNEQRVSALAAMAAALRAHAPEVLAANAADMEAARAKGTDAGLLDRLYLDESRVEDMAAGIEALAALPDAVGRVLEEREIACGLHLQRVSVPLGVVAMIYEARPNVTSDAAAICIRTGNACLLRGGSLAQRSCVAIAHVLAAAAEEAGCPAGSVAIIETTDRAATDELMSLHGLVDVLIPRGGAGLIRHCVEHARVPVIETGTGNCHVYVHESADFAKARAIIVNAKTQRVGVCNACESLLVDEKIAPDFLPLMLSDLADHGVKVHGDAQMLAAAVVASEARAAAAAEAGEPAPAPVTRCPPPRRTGAASTWRLRSRQVRERRGRGGGARQPLRHRPLRGHRGRGPGGVREVPGRGGRGGGLRQREHALHRRRAVRAGRRDRHLHAEAARARALRGRGAHELQVRDPRGGADAPVAVHTCRAWRPCHSPLGTGTAVASASRKN